MLTYREHAAPPELRTLIECLWIAHDPRPRRTRPRERVIPDGCPEIIVQLGDPFRRLIGGRWRVQPRAFLAGTLSAPWHLRAGRRLRTFGIRFRPAALTRLFDCDMAAAADREVPLARLAGTESAAALVAALASAKGAAGVFRAGNRWLLERRRAAPRAHATDARRAVRLVNAARGRVRVAELAATLGVTRRSLERAFARDLGIRPKLFARIVRLQAAIATLDHAERGSAVDRALEAGYFDQAHLARDFRAIAGRRALHPRAADGEMARHFSGPDRLLALLAGE